MDHLQHFINISRINCAEIRIRLRLSCTNNLTRLNIHPVRTVCIGRFSIRSRNETQRVKDSKGGLITCCRQIYYRFVCQILQRQPVPNLTSQTPIYKMDYRQSKNFFITSDRVINRLNKLPLDAFRALKLVYTIVVVHVSTFYKRVIAIFGPLLHTAQRLFGIVVVRIHHITTSSSASIYIYTSIPFVKTYFDLTIHPLYNYEILPF